MKNPVRVNPTSLIIQRVADKSRLAYHELTLLQFGKLTSTIPGDASCELRVARCETFRTSTVEVVDESCDRGMP